MSDANGNNAIPNGEQPMGYAHADVRDDVRDGVAADVRGGADAGLVSRRDFTRLAALAGAGAILLGGSVAAFGSLVWKHALRTTQLVTDDWGRTVEIPAPNALERVYFSGPIGQIMLFTLRPDLIAGTTLPFTPEELAMLPEGTADLPFMGSLSENVAFDIDAMQSEGIQLIISAVGDDDHIEAIGDLDAFQAECGIPVLQFRAGFDSMGDAYRKIGAIVGAERRAEELASYLGEIYDRVTAAIKDVPVERRVRLYYAEGPEGLQTEPFSSAHANTFAVSGAYNVAEVEMLDEHGMTDVTIDDVRAWDPEVIVAWDERIRNGASQLIVSDPDWADIKAVRDGRVYTMPNVPYSWCDRPAGPNRCIGIQWIANLLYPEYYDVDMVEVTRDFYRTMWRIDITQDQARTLLGL